jgi:hypothetical protein
MEGDKRLEKRIYIRLACHSNSRVKSHCFMDFIKDLWLFLMERKKWWLLPMIIVLVLIGVLVVIGGGSAVAPFVYTLF